MSAIAKTVRYSLVVVGLVIVGLLVAPFFIDVNVYKSQIEQTVEDATGRKLAIGNINASLFPWVGVELDDVHFANRPGFADRDFLSVKKLHVKLALMPLLSKNIEIKHFEVVSPVVYLERRSNGETNWGDLVSSHPDSGSGTSGSAGGSVQDAPAAPALAALQAESLSLSSGKVTWVDGDAKPVVLSELDVALKDVQLQRPVSVKLSGKLSGNAFELDANVGPLGDLAKLDPVSLPVQGHLKADNISLAPFKSMISGWPEQLGDVAKAVVGISAQIEQRPDGIRLGEGELHLNAAHALGLNWKVELPKPDKLNVSRASLAVDGMSLLDAKGSVQKLTTNPVFKLRVDGHPVARSWLTAFVPDLKAMYAGHPAPWKQFKFSALLSGSSKQMDIRDMQLMLDGDLLQVTGEVAFAGPDIRLRMNANQLHLDPWLPQGSQQQAALNENGFSFVREAIAAADIEAEPDLRFLKSWVVTSRLQIGTLFMRGLEMGNFSAAINGSKGRFNISPLSFNLAGGKVVEKASINAAAYPASWKESVRIRGVQVGPLLRALAGVDKLEGTMEMDTALRARGLTQTAMRTLNGRGNVLLKNGKLKGIDIAGAIRKFTDPAAYREGPQETDFAQLSGTFNIRNGIANNPDLFMASPLLRVTGAGNIDLVNQQLDYKVKPRVVGTLKGQGDSVLRKGLTVPLRITGPLASPKVRPDIDAKSLIENAPKLIEDAPKLLDKKNLGGALGNILGGAAPGGQKQPAGQGGAQVKPRSQGSRIQPQSRPEPKPQPKSPQQQLLEGLGGAIPGF